MTLACLIDFASFGAAMDKYATNGEYEDIHDFAKTCHDLIDTDLEDLRLSRRDHAERQKEGFLS